MDITNTHSQRAVSSAIWQDIFRFSQILKSTSQAFRQMKQQQNTNKILVILHDDLYDNYLIAIKKMYLAWLSIRGIK